MKNMLILLSFTMLQKLEDSTILTVVGSNPSDDIHRLTYFPPLNLYYLQILWAGVEEKHGDAAQRR